MIDADKLALFQWVSLRRRRINFGLIGGRIVLVFGGRTPPGAHVVDRLDAVVDEQEGLTDDGWTLNVGALGIASIAKHLATFSTYARSPQRLHERLYHLFAGSGFFPEMLAATVRTAFNDPGPGGDCGYYIDAAKRQMQSWTAGNVSVRVVQSDA